MALALSFYIISFLLSLRSPYLGFVALVCSVLIRLQDRVPGIVAIKPFALLLMGLMIGCYIHRAKLAKHDWKQDRLLIYMLVLSIFGLLIMARFAIVKETWEYLTSLSMYFFASRILQNRNQIIWLFVAMACCITYMGYEAIVSVQMFGETSPFIDPRNGRWQGLGYYENANEFGQLMITTMPILMAILVMRKNILLMAAAIGMSGILIFVMAKTGSRTVMSIFGLMLILTFALRGKGNVVKKAFVAGIMGVVVLGILSVAPGPVRDRLNTIRDAGSDESFQGRVRSWGYGFDMVSWYPLTGVGKGQWMEHHGLMPHNSYVQIMAELGPIGIYLFIWILILSYREFKPFFSDISADPPDSKNLKIPGSIWDDNESPEEDSALEVDNGELTEDDWFCSDKKDKSAVTVSEIDPADKTVVIAIIVVMTGWLIYIFLGNQGYSVWNYFYIGLCACVRNLLPPGMLTTDNKPKKEPLFAD